jgi:hypothetical protein
VCQRANVSTTPRHAGPLPAAPDQLAHLGDELDFANAARAEFDIRAHRNTIAFSIDTRLHDTQRLDRAKVEISAEDERPQRFDQSLPGITIAGAGPRADPCIPFPIRPCSCACSIASKCSTSAPLSP